jgi:hypothetical protein
VNFISPGLSRGRGSIQNAKDENTQGNRETVQIYQFRQINAHQDWEKPLAPEEE